MPLRTRRWNDPKLQGDGFRLLITRFRPRGLKKADETWDAWMKELGPSEELHAAVYGKRGPKLKFLEYRERYLVEIAGQEEAIRALAKRSKAGEMITLLCSTACINEGRCHRTILAGLIEEAEKALP